MDVEKAAKATAVFIVVMIALTILYDIYIYVNYGGDATISRAFLKSARSHPIVAVLFGLIVGILAGHFWFPQIVKEKDEETSPEDLTKK